MTAASPRTAAVTGAAGGIGSAVCRRLAADGFLVACLDVSAAAAAEVAVSLPGAIGLAVDVRDAVSVRAAGDQIRAALGAPWLLVNVAAARHTARPGADWCS
jgi:NAD(P)-dependent dehydrogenase (short-subunit alcohol dehydrogenase family)